MRNPSFAGLNTLNLESRLLTRAELNTIDGRDLFTRVKNIIFNARRKVSSPEHGTGIVARLFMILNKGTEAMASGNLETLKSFYRDTYLPLVQQDMSFDVSSGPADFSRAVDSEWADYFDSSLTQIDQTLTSLKYGGDEVNTASYPMNGFGSADGGWDTVTETGSSQTGANNTLMRAVQWGTFFTASYFAYKYFMGKKSKR